MGNRKLAWVVVIPLMVVSVFIGSFTTYMQTSRRIEATFREEAAPVLNDIVEVLYNMVDLHRHNNTDEALLTAAVQSIIETQAQIENFEQVDVQKLQENATALQILPEGFDEAHAGWITRLYYDMIGLSDTLRQTSYNQVAKEFNAGILSNFGKLPTF